MPFCSRRGAPFDAARAGLLGGVFVYPTERPLKSTTEGPNESIKVVRMELTNARVKVNLFTNTRLHCH